jgi:hypothetical protein
VGWDNIGAWKWGIVDGVRVVGGRVRNVPGEGSAQNCSESMSPRWDVQNARRKPPRIQRQDKGPDRYEQVQDALCGQQPHMRTTKTAAQWRA